MTALTQAIDDRGNPYQAVRPRVCQSFSIAAAGNTTTAAFNVMTKVVRIASSAQVNVTLSSITGSFVVTSSYFVDLIVYAGETLNIANPTGGPTAQVSVTELQ